MENYNSNSGALVATGSISLNVRGMNHAGIGVSGTFVGTVSFEGTIDGVNWVAIKDQLGGASATTTTAPGSFIFNIGGFSEIRARVSAYTSGTVGLGVTSSLS